MKKKRKESVGRTEKKAMDRPLGTAFTASQKQEKRQRSKLNLTKRSNWTKESTFIKPRRKVSEGGGCARLQHEGPALSFLYCCT